MFERLRRRRNRINCRRATELMTDYLEDALSNGNRARFEAHLAECDACTAYLDQMRAAVAAVGGLDAETLPRELRDELVVLYKRFHSS